MTELKPLTRDERILGYLAWRLVGDWPAWVKRRVESITYETATSIRRRVSVDLRLRPDLFQESVVHWGTTPIHYVPLAQLRKRRLVRFDLRDEAGQVLPLITKRKNTAIATAMLCAATQAVVAGTINAAGSTFAFTDPSQIVLPEWLEHDFWLLAYREARPSSGQGSLSIVERYLGAASNGNGLSPERWTWITENGRHAAQVSEEHWRALLGSDSAFVRLAYDIARLYFIYAPLAYEADRRRVVKYSYSEYLGDEEPIFGGSIKKTSARMGFARAWNMAEDWLEGLPRADPQIPDQWMPPLQAEESPPVRRRRRIFEAIGWTSRIGKFETPGVGRAASYHVNVSTPSGIQIRRAQLVTTDTPEATNAKSLRHPAQRGNRTLRSVDLYIAGAQQATGNVFVNLRPESSLIIRAACLSALVIAAMLTALYLFASRVIGEDGAHTDAVAAALVVVPGLLTVMGIRDAEHPLATSMVFGLRLLAIVPGILAFMAAAEVLIERPDGSFGIVLFSLAWAVAGLLAVAWRLAARGRPHPASLPTRSDHPAVPA